ncbi:hypothetical protein BKA70DRAFT_1437156 [Coprinopsis sp. MPI-PUGE-AT-0042]|nr:hypothetical protein BKA70DRAFT_1437156 [Coprinopsis sp. MPI-PUGE-AT-0042]
MTILTSCNSSESDLEEPVATHFTSDTAMHPYHTKWIRRTAVSSAQPTAASPAGHTAFYSKHEVDSIEVCEIPNLYRQVYKDLAILVIPGVKFEKEKFAGGLYTTTLEGFIPTSGHVQHPIEDMVEKRKHYVWQNLLGLSTRAIGMMVIVPGDNQGLVLPPRIASVQAVIVPYGITAKTSNGQRANIDSVCEELVQPLRKTGVRAKADLRDGYTLENGRCGVPLGLGLEPNQLSKEQTLTVRRDTGAQNPDTLDDIGSAISSVGETIQADTFATAKKTYWEHVRTRSWNETTSFLRRTPRT